MTEEILSQYRALINRQIQNQNFLYDPLSKADSLVKVALETNFSEFPQYVLHCYFWAINDLIEDSLGFHEKGLDELLQFEEIEF